MGGSREELFNLNKVPVWVNGWEESVQNPDGSFTLKNVSMHSALVMKDVTIKCAEMNIVINKRINEVDDSEGEGEKDEL